MKRRSFFRMLAGLACAPLLPKIAAKAPNLDFTIRGLDPLPVATLGCQGAIGPSCPIGLEPTPVGTLAAFVGNSAPKGWHMCDGTEIDPNHQLAEILPSFKLPELEGFIIKADLSS